MNVRHRVDLDQPERDELLSMLHGGKHPARKLKRAQILLAADAGLGDEAIAATVAVGGSTVYRIKRRFMEMGLEAALGEAPRAGAERNLTGKEEALLVATPARRRAAPAGRWSCWLTRSSS
ncbi:transposase [Sinorhizobium fredii]